MGLPLHLMLRALGGGVVKLPASGLLSEWRFSEGSGATVADSAGGGRQINLDLPTTPNYTWTPKGVSTASGLVQTPSIPGARTVVMLYRTGRNQTPNFLISGGPSSGSGLLQESTTPAFTYHICANGVSVTPLLRHTTGSLSRQANRGGWVLVFQQFDAAYTTALGFGGRHSTTTSRCADFEVAWACVYSSVLSADDRTQIYNHVRGTFAKPRGIYIHRLDCPTQAKLIAIAGQSNASGRALRSDLTAPEAARVFTKVWIASGTNSARPTIPPGVLLLGTNQTAETPGGQFGPETPIAWGWEDNQTSDLYICKVTQGSTYLAPSSLGAPVTESNTWNPTEAIPGSIGADLIHDFCDVVQSAATSGIGLDYSALFWMQGEQHATSVVYGAVYQTQLQALYEWLSIYTGAPGKIIVGRIAGQDPTFDPTALAQVRAAQTAFVAATPGAVLIDTDAYPLAVDLVHYNAAGMRLLGAAVYAAIAA